MTIPAGFPYPLKQEVEIPLDQIIPNPDQPRKLEDKEAIQLLAASMKAKGQEVAARVRPLTETERVAHPGIWVMLIGGHGRREAAILNQFKTLKCTVEDIAPEETLSTAARDNAIRNMHWWEWYLIIEGVDKASPKSQRDIADELAQNLTRVNSALKVTKTLNPAARALVLENLQKTLKNGVPTPNTKNKDFSITEQTLLVLAGLEDPAQVLPALQEVLDNYLTTDQAQKLVEHIQAGHPIETFRASAPSPKSPRKDSGNLTSGTSPTGSHPAHHSHPTHLAPTGSLSLSADSISGAETASAPKPQVEGHALSAPISQKEEIGEEPGWFDKWLVGIKYIGELRRKVKQGEALTNTEKMYAGLDKFYQAVLRPAGKRIGHFLKWALKGIWHSLKKAVGKVFGKTVEVLLPWVIVAGLVWGLLAFFHFAVISPWHWIEHKIGLIFHHEDITPAQPIPASTPQPVASTILPAPQPVIHQALEKKPEKPAITYQPAVSFVPTASPLNSSPSQTQYDPKLFEQEIAAIPPNSVVKDYPLAPDETMPADLAVSRLQDLTDADRYTMMIGGDKQKILSFTPSNTNFILAYQNTDPLGIFGGGGPRQMNFFWEDVKYIHADEIDVENKTPTQFYQCSLVVSGSKNPLTIQCASADDLKNLVSTLEYFIRHSRLGHDAQPGGLPYPDWGVKLSNDGVVTLLWADSPMDNAGVDVGGMIWSLDKDTENQPDRNKMEAALRALTPGSHALFVVSRDECVKARDTERSTNGFFHPKRRKVVLVAS